MHEHHQGPAEAQPQRVHGLPGVGVACFSPEQIGTPHQMVLVKKWVTGNMGQNLRSPVGLILTHTQIERQETNKKGELIGPPPPQTGKEPKSTGPPKRIPPPTPKGNPRRPKQTAFAKIAPTLEQLGGRLGVDYHRNLLRSTP